MEQMFEVLLCARYVHWRVKFTPRGKGLTATSILNVRLD